MSPLPPPNSLRANRLTRRVTGITGIAAAAAALALFAAGSAAPFAPSLRAAQTWSGAAGDGKWATAGNWNAGTGVADNTFDLGAGNSVSVDLTGASVNNAGDGQQYGIRVVSGDVTLTGTASAYSIRTYTVQNGALHLRDFAVNGTGNPNSIVLHHNKTDAGPGALHFYKAPLFRTVWNVAMSDVWFHAGFGAMGEQSNAFNSGMFSQNAGDATTLHYEHTGAAEFILIGFGNNIQNGYTTTTTALTFDIPAGATTPTVKEILQGWTVSGCTFTFTKAGAGTVNLAKTTPGSNTVNLALAGGVLRVTGQLAGGTHSTVISGTGGKIEFALPAGTVQNIANSANTFTGGMSVTGGEVRLTVKAAAQKDPANLPIGASNAANTCTVSNAKLVIAIADVFGWHDSLFKQTLRLETGGELSATVTGVPALGAVEFAGGTLACNVVQADNSNNSNYMDPAAVDFGNLGYGCFCFNGGLSATGNTVSRITVTDKTYSVSLANGDGRSANTWTIEAGSTLDVAAAIRNGRNRNSTIIASNLTKAGDGELLLRNAAVHTGATVVAGGTLRLSHNAANGSKASIEKTSSLTVNSGAALALDALPDNAGVALPATTLAAGATLLIGSEGDAGALRATDETTTVGTLSGKTLTLAAGAKIRVNLGAAGTAGPLAGAKTILAFSDGATVSLPATGAVFDLPAGYAANASGYGLLVVRNAPSATRGILTGTAPAANAPAGAAFVEVTAADTALLAAGLQTGDLVLLPFALEITTQPVAETAVTIGAAVTLNAAATGDGLVWQWQKLVAGENGADDFFADVVDDTAGGVTGSATASLVFTAATPAHNGVYRVVVTDKFGRA
ncbi:MAG: hypothetical protein LBR07_09900, partial [Puniceicoccales bacterium]|nr:hypothetical protein [Puniceicoccales bacterium]